MRKVSIPNLTLILIRTTVYIAITIAFTLAIAAIFVILMQLLMVMVRDAGMKTMISS